MEDIVPLDEGGSGGGGVKVTGESRPHLPCRLVRTTLARMELARLVTIGLPCARGGVMEEEQALNDVSVGLITVLRGAGCVNGTDSLPGKAQDDGSATQGMLGI